MSLTLGQAKPFLAPAVNDGVCESASILTVKINEGAARLHAMGDYIGTIQRAGSTVVNGVFETPSMFQDVRRVSKLPAGIPHSETGTVFMDDADAFIFDDAGVLPVRQVGTNRRKIIGNLPEAVDIMGKVKVVYAANDDDVLPIDDVYALKLAVLALSYEDGQQTEMAQAMWTQADAYLKSKTETAIVGARRTKFTTILSSAAQNTVGYARAKIALATTDGLAVDDHKTLSLVNDSEEFLMAQTGLWVEGLFKTRQGVFAIPADMSAIHRVAVNNCPSVLRSQWFEFVQGGCGYREGTHPMNKGDSVIKRGLNALHTDMPEASVLTVISTGDDLGVLVNIEGMGEGGKYLRETVTVSAGQQTDTTNIFYSVKSITKDPSVSDIIVAAGGTEVAYLYAWQQDSEVMRYFVPSCSDCRESIIRVIGRPRFFPKTSDYQKLQVAYPYAISLAAQGVLLQRAGQADAAMLLKKEAIEHVTMSMGNDAMGEAMVMDKQTRGMGIRRSHEPAMNKFFVGGVPRSGTAWCSAFLSGPDHICLHEGLKFSKGQDDYVEFIRHGAAGDSGDHIPMLFEDLIRAYPDAGFVVIDRPVDESKASAKAIGLASTIVDMVHKKVELMKAHPKVAVIPFSRLFTPEGAEILWNATLKTPFDRARFEVFRRLNIQATVASHVESIEFAVAMLNKKG